MAARWSIRRPGDSPVLTRDDSASPLVGEVVVEVAGCLLDPRDADLASRAAGSARFPLVPGRHCSGRVIAAGPKAAAWIGRPVVVPEILPCGDCPACRRALPLHCRDVVRPGVTHPGGLCETLVVPARFLLPLDGPLTWSRPLGEAAGVGFFALPYQAVVSAGVGAGDVAVAFDDPAASQILHSKGVRDPGTELPDAGRRLLLRAGARIPPLPPGAVIVAYGDEGSLDLRTQSLWTAEGTVRFVRVCHPDLYPEITALLIRGELAVDLPEMPWTLADQALSRCASGPLLVLRE